MRWHSKVCWGNIVTRPYFPTIGRTVAELYGYLTVFNMAAVRHVGFLNLKSLTTGMVIRVNVHYHVKFRCDKSNRY